MQKTRWKKMLGNLALSAIVFVLLYPTLDNHWNTKGAAPAYQWMYEALEKKIYK